MPGMSSSSRNRVPEGVPTGGQFAAERKDETHLSTLAGTPPAAPGRSPADEVHADQGEPSSQGGVRAEGLAGDVDAIMQHGEYTDRRGRVWFAGAHYWHRGGTPFALTPDEMRRKATRELHRAQCPGVAACPDHPVPAVFAGGPGARGGFGPWIRRLPGSAWARISTHSAFGDAIAAARNMIRGGR